jgi:CPA2 family monovalent cation:H+ antiporter-2
MHDLSLISTIAAAFTAAWLLGLLTQRLKLSPIVGYLLAGVLIGPHTPGFVGDQAIANQLAEVGVILLMFGVGLHFHLKDLLAVRNVAVPGAVVQSLCATVAAMLLFNGFGMPYSTGAVIGMAMAVASTVVLMRVLMDADSLSTREGHVAVGWLIVEDVFTVILLVIIPVLGTAPAGDPHAPAGDSSLWATLAIALGKLALLAVVVLWAGSRVIPALLVRVAKLRSRELFTLTVLVFSIAVAAASYFFFGASMALGAFLAGMVVAQSPVSNQAAADALPMRDAFAVLFFVSVGMLFDPSYLVREPLMILAALSVILLVKPLAALAIVAVLGYSARTALTVALGLAQIGEFSFILSELARRYQLMPDEGHNVLVASAILSITLNPFLFRQLPAIEGWLRRHPALWKMLNARAEKRLARETKLPEQAPAEESGRRRAIVIGYGPVGRTIHHVLEESGLDVVVVDMNMDTISTLRNQGKFAIYGDASNWRILEEAGLAKASHLVVTVPDGGQRAAIITAARALNPYVRMVVRARYLAERAEMERHGVSEAVFEEAEAAIAMARLVMNTSGLHRDDAREKLQEIRFRLALESFSEFRETRVSSVMIPSPRILGIEPAMDRATAVTAINRNPHRYYPVLDPDSHEPVGYVATSELAGDRGNENWDDCVRPLCVAAPEDTVGDVFATMAAHSSAMCVIRQAGKSVGIVTRGHLLDQIENAFGKKAPRQAAVRLSEAIARGSIICPLTATDRDGVIRELATHAPAELLPPGIDGETLAGFVFSREAEISTDLGNGIALPHARCPGLDDPFVVVGHSEQGIAYSLAAEEPAHLFFLLVTPSEHPETHLALLGQIARMMADPAKREGLRAARTPVELAERLG